MDTEMGETPEGLKQDSDSSTVNEVRVNGEINGPCNEELDKSYESSQCTILPSKLASAECFDSGTNHEVSEKDINNDTSEKELSDEESESDNVDEGSTVNNINGHEEKSEVSVNNSQVYNTTENVENDSDCETSNNCETSDKNASSDTNIENDKHVTNNLNDVPLAKEEITTKDNEPKSFSDSFSTVKVDDNGVEKDSSDKGAASTNVEVSRNDDVDELNSINVSDKINISTCESDTSNTNNETQNSDSNSVSGKILSSSENKTDISDDKTEDNSDDKMDCSESKTDKNEDKSDCSEDKTDIAIVIDDDKDDSKLDDPLTSSDSLNKSNEVNDDSKSDGTPGKIKKSRKSVTPVNVTPRRSSRNIQKAQKSQLEKDDDPDIELITPEDPLAGPPASDPFKDKENNKVRHTKKTTIVVNDTKRLVEIAAGSKPTGKKEPTLVIIDTNSILSGRGPVPVSQSQSPASATHSSSHNSAHAAPNTSLHTSHMPSHTSHTSLHNSPSYPLPVAVPAQGMYPARPTPPPAPKPPPQILPTLTDDMYVVEAPSFIVPYVYEKPPLKPLKEFIEKMGKEVEEEKKRRANKDSLNDDDSCKSGEGKDIEEIKDSNKTDVSEVKESNEMSTPEEKKDGEESEKATDALKSEQNKPLSYFENPLGKFFIDIGSNLVQEYVQIDLLRSQKKKLDRDGGKPTSSATQYAISSLIKNLEFSKENNEPFRLNQRKCDHCSFRTESALVMAQHLETPHMRNYVYRCNFCPLEVRSPHDILFHMEAEHNVRGRLERAPAFHQCPNCPFEDNQKGKLSRHLLSCAKKFRPEKNLEPPPDWEPPAKIPRISRNRPPSLGIGTAAYQALTNKQAQQQHPLLPKLVPSPSFAGNLAAVRGRGRPPIHNRYLPEINKMGMSSRPIAPTQIRQNMLYRSGAPNSQMLLPTTYQIAGNQLYQVGSMMPMMAGGMPRLTIMPPTTPAGSSTPTPVALVPNLAAGGNSITIQNANKNNPAAKLLQQPSISITPLPRQPANVQSQNVNHNKQGASPSAASGGKATFVICEICDGYIKDLEQLRNHMQWIHKVKIHPKMIYNRPPLNCQKCQFRFFTDQGLERHLLGSHGLVTSSMQEAANKGKDGGRCPICGRVYQWKLLNHVARDHNMTLKPAHLSYKCTVCTATFGMYKQFENHVYSAHSVVAKRAMDKKTAPPSSQSTDSILKPLKINDEITIIPQPARHRPGPASRTGAVANNGKVYECEECEATYDGPVGFSNYVAHVRRKHTKRCAIKLCRLDACPTCKKRHVTPNMLEYIEERRNNMDVIELSDDEMVIGQGRNEITITKVSCAPGPKRFKLRLQRKQQKGKVQVIEIEDSPVKSKGDDGENCENGEDSLNAVKERLRRRKSLEISQIDGDCPSPQTVDEVPAKKRRKNDD